MGNSVEPMSEGAGLAHGEEDPDRSMEKPKAWKHMKKTIATRPQKRKSEYSMVLEERKARRLRLTGFKESAALLRAKSHDRNAINRALSKLTRTEEWIGSTSQEQRIEAISEERKKVLAYRLTQGISERALTMKFMKWTHSVIGHRNGEDWRLDEQSTLKDDLNDEELEEMEKVLKNSEEYGLEYLESELQGLQQEKIEDEYMEKVELNDFKEMEIDDSEEEESAGEWETELEKMEKGLRKLSKQELREERREEKMEKVRYMQQQKKDLRRLKSRRELEKLKKVLAW